jgi:hypothetical protein
MRAKPPINVTEITYEKPEGVGGNPTPLFAEAVYEGKPYLVSVSSRTQMTQQVFNAYVEQELGDEQLPTIQRKAFSYAVVSNPIKELTSRELGVRTYQGKTYLIKGDPGSFGLKTVINPNDPVQIENAGKKYAYVRGDNLIYHVNGNDISITAAQREGDNDLKALYAKIKTEQDKGPSRGYSSIFLASAAAEPTNNQIGVWRDQRGAVTIKINQDGRVKSTVISANEMLDPRVQELCDSIERQQLPIDKLLYYTTYKESWTSFPSSYQDKIAGENSELSHGIKGKEVCKSIKRPRSSI